MDETTSAGRSARRNGSASGEKDAADAIENAVDVAAEAIFVNGVEDGSLCTGKKSLMGGWSFGKETNS